MIYGVYKGISMGFTSTIINFLKIVLALFVALRFSSLFSRILEKALGITSAYTPLLSFILVLGFAIAILHIIGIAAGFLLKSTQIMRIIHVISVAAWLLMLFFGFSTLITFAERGGLITDNVINSSIVFPYLESASDIMFCKMGSFFDALGGVLGAIKKLLGGLAERIIGNCSP